MADGAADGLYKEIGRKIRDVRERAQPKLSQDKLAKRLGMSRASVVNIEAGRQHPPLHLLWQIADILGTDLVLLIPRRDELMPPATAVPLDKVALEEIGRAAKGNPEIQKALTVFVSKLKINLEATEKRKVSK
jgi:transcriptional regulator with XRE-family HTH domain